MQASSDPLPSEDHERFALIRSKLYTPVIGDVLDQLDRRHQFLGPGLVPLEPDMVVVGRAMPVLVAPVFGVQERPFGRLTEALDQLIEGEVYVAAAAGIACAAWGEILTATARMRGATGAVIDGFHRDTPQILTQNWPVFSRGAYAQDSSVRSAVLDYRVPVEINGVTVAPGDLIVADRDGVLVVPADVEQEVLERALAKASTENLVLAAILGGLSSTEAFAQYGVL